MTSPKYVPTKIRRELVQPWPAGPLMANRRNPTMATTGSSNGETWWTSPFFQKNAEVSHEKTLPNHWILDSPLTHRSQDTEPGLPPADYGRKRSPSTTPPPGLENTGMTHRNWEFLSGKNSQSSKGNLISFKGKRTWWQRRLVHFSLGETALLIGSLVWGKQITFGKNTGTT